MEPPHIAISRIGREHHGVFALHHLNELGLTKRQREHALDTGRWDLVFEGVYRISGAPSTWKGDLLAACWAGGTRAVASHRSAAALWDLPGGSTDVLELVCPRWRRARHDSLIVHESTRLDPVDITAVDAIPCTTVERTLFDLSSVLGPAGLDYAFDAALRRELTTVSAVSTTAARLATQGRRGGRKFKAAVEERIGKAGVSESKPERRIARLLVSHGLPEPELQYVVRDERGEFIGRVDAAYPEHRIVIEYDSYQEHTGKVALVNDSRRRNGLLAAGWTPLVATAADLRDGDTLVRSIRRARDRREVAS